MIGPHEGRELDLMLRGEKHLALFYDVVKPGYQTPETIIPEQAFAPHVANGSVLRFEKHFPVKDGRPVRYVCFTSPQESWRAEAFFQARSRSVFDDAYEYLVGRLLGYADADIEHFIEHSKSFRAA